MVDLLVLGSGDREHDLAEKRKRYEAVKDVFCAPGNGGTALSDGITNIEYANDSAFIFHKVRSTRFYEDLLYYFTVRELDGRSRRFVNATPFKPGYSLNYECWSGIMSG